MKSRTRGDVSLEALILFIAVVISTGIAAILIMQTNATLQSKSLVISGEEKKQVTSGFEILDIQGTDATPPSHAHFLEDIFIKTRPLPGGIHQSLNDTIIYINDGSGQYEITFNTTCPAACLASTTSHYNIYYLKHGTRHEDNYINLGDVGIIAIKLRRPFKEDMQYQVGVVPAYGPKTLVDFVTPISMTKTRITLWPVS